MDKTYYFYTDQYSPSVTREYKYGKYILTFIHTESLLNGYNKYRKYVPTYIYTYLVIKSP